MYPCYVYIYVCVYRTYIRVGAYNREEKEMMNVELWEIGSFFPILITCVHCVKYFTCVNLLFLPKEPCEIGAIAVSIL